MATKTADQTVMRLERRQLQWAEVCQNRDAKTLEQRAEQQRDTYLISE